jgi:hypothetical protein
MRWIKYRSGCASRAIHIPQIVVRTPAGVPHVVVNTPPSPSSTAQALSSVWTSLEHAPLSAAVSQDGTSEGLVIHATPLQAWNTHWMAGSSAAAHAGPFVGSARAMQPGTFVSMAVVPAESHSTPPALEAPASVAPSTHATQPALAALIWNALHVELDDVDDAHAARNPVICAALQALTILTTGT